MADISKDFGDWVSQEQSAEIVMRFAATEDGNYKSDVNYEEVLETAAYKDLVISLVATASTTFGDTETDLLGFFLNSDQPLKITLNGSVFDGMTFMYVRMPVGSGVKTVTVENTSPVTATISLLLLEGP